MLGLDLKTIYMVKNKLLKSMEEEKIVTNDRKQWFLISQHVAKLEITMYM